MRFTNFCAAVAIGLVSSSAAIASVVGGGITGGSAFTGGGAFIELDGSTGFTVGNNNFDNLNLYAFNEDQNIMIPSNIAVNIGTSPMLGDIVASHYVFFDPANNPTQSQIGYVDFDADIYGVATSGTSLGASDFLANTSVTYLNPTLRGLESGDSVMIDPLNTKRLLVDWSAGTPGDYVRVFTMKSPIAAIPLPASGLLLIGAFAGLAGLRRRKR